jgi:asparagine synthase (glutamine-hydrolysing)
MLFDRNKCIDQNMIDAMLRSIAHRGPDSQAMHIDGNVGLGHCRLSIIDLGGGLQPMANEDDTIWIVFNGEIYNFHELRKDLVARGHVFRSHSDTEVIIHLYEEYGPDCVNHLRGMFAFAIWDANRRRIFLARDRVGIKPLYYFINGKAIAFASELKALLGVDGFSNEVDPNAVDAFWCFNYLPGELTMFEGVRKLLPGHSIEVDDSGRHTVRQYWDLKVSSDPREISFEAATAELSELLREAVRQHMIADVPVGFLLSGGMDSSAVLAYATQETDREVSTFTIGFEGQGVVDERPYARLMAEKYGTRHFETTISAKQFWDYLPQLMWHLDDPICEPPAVALHSISELARNHVKVLLSGEGGDEAFGGYPNYPNQLALERLRRMLGPLRHFAGKGASAIGRLMGRPRLAEYGRMLQMELQEYYWSRVGSPMGALVGRNGVRYDDEFRARLGDGQGGFMQSLFRQVKGASHLNQMLYVDTKTWLPDDLLVKADKITMASSIELRVPLLDHKVLEFAAELPADYKVRGKETKRVLKAAFGNVLPRQIIERKKVGFPVPYSRWLAGELWSNVRELLLEPGNFVSTYFERSSLESILLDHRRTGRRQRELFSLVALEIWHQQFAGKTKAPAPRNCELLT